MKWTTLDKMLEVVKPHALRSFNGEQILKLIPWQWRMSWGFRKPSILIQADEIDKKHDLNHRAILFTVNGHNHKGFVSICLNGADLFNVYYFSTHGNLKKESTDIYFDQLAEVMDCEIERQKNYVS